MGTRRLRWPAIAPAAVVTVLVVIVSLSFAGPAAAGGSWFDPVKDRYEPGDEVTLVGYTGSRAHGWIDDGPYLGFVTAADEDLAPIEGSRFDVGEIELTETGQPGYARLRASVTFALPTDLPPGVYRFDYCNAVCGELLGDLIGGFFNVGIDPAFPVNREWPLTEPEIANLDDRAIIAGPGFEITAAEARAESAGTDAASASTVATTPTTIATTTTGQTTTSTTTASSTSTTNATVAPSESTEPVVAPAVEVDVSVEPPAPSPSRSALFGGLGLLLVAAGLVLALRRGSSGPPPGVDAPGDAAHPADDAGVADREPVAR